MKFLRLIWGRKTDSHTKFQPNRTFFAEVIHLDRFSAARLVGLVARGWFLVVLGVLT